MANRYWVGGTGTWDGSNTANWSASSGGAGGASVPIAIDDVFFDASSNVGTGSFTVTMSTSTRVCRDITISGLDGAMTLAGTVGLTVSGSLSFPSTNLTITYTGTTQFNSSTTGRTVTTSGLTFQGSVTFGAIGGGWQLLDALTTLSSATTTLSGGTLDLNNFTVTTGIFNASSSATRRIEFGTTGSIVLTSTTAGATVLIMTDASSFTFTGTSNIRAAMTVTRTFRFADPSGGTAANRLNINLTSGASVPTFTGSFRQINFTGSTCDPGTVTINCGGFTLASGGNYTNTTFLINSSGGTATFTGKSIAALSVSAVSNSLVLQDAGTTLTSSGTFLNSGTLDLNNFTLTTWGFFSNVVVTPESRSVAFGTTGSIVLNASSGSQTVLNIADARLFTYTGTSNFISAMTVTRTFNYGSSVSGSFPPNINLTSGASTPTFSGTMGQINFTGSTSTVGSTVFCLGFTLASGGTYTGATFNIVGTGTIGFAGKTISALTVNPSTGDTTTLQDAGIVSGTTLFQGGQINLNNFTLTTAIFSSSNSSTRSINFGSTGSIVLNSGTAGAVVLAMANALAFTFTGTSNISAAMTTTRTFNFGGTNGASTANRLNINLTSGASVPTFTGSFRQINFTGSTSNPGAVTINCHGFTLASGGTYTGTSVITVGSGTLTYTGKSISVLNIAASGITTTLADAAINGTTTLTSGTLDLAGFTLTSTTTTQTAAGTKNLTFNGGTLLISTSWNNASPIGFTTTAGTGTGTISMTSASPKTFVGGGSIYNCTLNQGGVGTLTITGANTFNDITDTVPTASQITFPASTTTTVNNFTLSGTAGNLVSIRSSTPGTQFTLSDPAGLVTANFLNIQDSNATGGATWTAYLYNGNVDSGNNTGWIFASDSGFMFFFN